MLASNELVAALPAFSDVLLYMELQDERGRYIHVLRSWHACSLPVLFDSVRCDMPVVKIAKNAVCCRHDELKTSPIVLRVVTCEHNIEKRPKHQER